MFDITPLILYEKNKKKYKLYIDLYRNNCREIKKIADSKIETAPDYPNNIILSMYDELKDKIHCSKATFIKTVKINFFNDIDILDDCIGQLSIDIDSNVRPLLSFYILLLHFKYGVEYKTIEKMMSLYNGYAYQKSRIADSMIRLLVIEKVTN